jgi:heme-degrading monooxygenase HmoA
MIAKHRTLEVPPEHIDAGIDFLRKAMLPAAKQIQGFRGMIAMVDRETGKSVALTLWDSDEALEASERAGGRLRAEGNMPELKPVIERYEVVLTELPGPVTV